MNKIILHSGIWSVLALTAVMLGGMNIMASEGSVMDRINAADQPFDSHALPTVHSVTSKTVRVKEMNNGKIFRTLARKDAIERYRCSACHTEKEVRARDGLLFTHGDIVIDHGREGDTLACSDCHHSKERDFLVGKKEEKVDFDHSYQLCGKCHFRQKTDWVAGAHGKRVGYWAGDRVVYNCATCHNPHSPRFKKRMPATFSRPLDE